MKGVQEATWWQSVGKQQINPILTSGLSVLAGLFLDAATQEGSMVHSKNIIMSSEQEKVRHGFSVTLSHQDLSGTVMI